MAKSRGSKRIFYDAKVKRFRGPDGRFISYKRGIRSAPARKQYNRAPKKRRYLPPPSKPKVKPKVSKARKKLPTKKKPPPVPVIFELTKAPGQFMVFNAEAFTVTQLARLLLMQIEAGNMRFRFWYRLPEISIDYPTGIGSTEPLFKSRLTVNEVLSEVVGFIKGRGGFIKGKIIEYWFSRR